METTPLPTAELQKKYNQRKILMLVLSIVFDIVGVLTYFLPGIGEGFDLAWAPIAGFVMYVMYGGFLGVFGGMFVFLEELVPFTDIIPGFLIMWVVKYVFMAKKTQRDFYASKGDRAVGERLVTAAGKHLPTNG